MKKSTYENLDEYMIPLINKELRSFQFQGLYVWRKHLIFHNVLGIKDEFNAFSGVLNKFKAHYRIPKASLKGKKLSTGMNAAENFKTKLRKFIETENLLPEQIYKGPLFRSACTFAMERERETLRHKMSKQFVLQMPMEPTN